MGDERSVVFVVGCPRSGTNWTWGLLDAHPDTEALLPADLQDYDNPSKETGLFLRTDDDGLIRDTIELLQAQYPGKVVFEKTPFHALRLPRIWMVFPEAKVVFVRRGRHATINSMIRNLNPKGEPGGWTMKKAILVYNQTMRRWRAAKDDPRMLTVRYESLSDDPHEEVRRMFAFCGLEGHVEEAVAKNHKTPAFDVPGVFRRGEKESWREEMTQREQNMVERRCVSY